MFKKSVVIRKSVDSNDVLWQSVGDLLLEDTLTALVTSSLQLWFPWAATRGEITGIPGRK